MANAAILSFYDTATGSYSHLIYDHPGGHAAIVDPVLGYDAASGRTSAAGADRLLATLAEQRLTLAWILETHAHADHLSAAAYLKRHAGGRTGIGARITEVQRHFGRVFAMEAALAEQSFDVLFEDGERFAIGALDVEVITLPGHTAADVGYRVGDAVFVGDTLFMPDLGSARCDFPGGDAATLYRSAQRLLALPDDTRLFLCHDYPPPERAPCPVVTVAEQRSANLHLNERVDEADFVALRRARDATLHTPTLLWPALQVNIRAGEMPPPDANGMCYLKIPLNLM
ncbi:MBL fold metallo-hydrolase [Crenobacter sp. SG2305]|uniref:MBL fold metallo-hydrolase n=1 Tax=Crenobacter oryzisoli TaxID=3056844 RepID=UPI0025AA6187|nr:MBL fold metallo-hydrolase [Crenobacter sp. SG2305]MDN0083844.1 MBL fold metallo-hydrolase [Crenobacter sp. SG2305]